MPTGYTAPVQTGMITAFPEFALECARNFLMRDDPMDAPIPEAFTPSPYYAGPMREAQVRLATLQKTTPADADTAALAAYVAACAARADRTRQREVERQRYTAMLVQVRAWIPPSQDHQGLKTFMEEQLVKSISHDCSDDFDREPTRLTGANWLAQQIEQTAQSVAWYAKSAAEDIERTNGRTRWVQQLRASLRGGQ